MASGTLGLLANASKSNWGSFSDNDNFSFSQYGGMRLNDLTNGDQNKINGFLGWLREHKNMLSGSLDNAYRSYLSSYTARIAESQKNDVVNEMRSLYGLS